MPSYQPAKKGVEWIGYVALTNQANTNLFVVNPTIAAGDFKVSKDGGAFNDLNTLPAVTPAGGRAVKITLSTSEMNADNVVVQCVDAAGAEWCDLIIDLQPSVRQLDDLAFPTTSGRSLDVTATGAAGIDWGNVENPTTALGLTGTTVKTATDVEADTQDIQSRLPAALSAGRMDASVGAYQTGLAPLQPTTAGRTLDVTATGEAGIDWSNIGAPTTTQNLSGTTVKTATDLATGQAALASLITSVPDEVWNLTDGIEDGMTPRQMGQLTAGAAAGKTSGMETGTPTIRNVADTVDMVVGASDEDGNRTAAVVTYT